MKGKSIFRTTTVKRLAWSAAALCVGCCAIPVVAVAVGFTAIAGLGVYMEQAALGFFVASLVLFFVVLIGKRNPSCKLDCAPKHSASRSA